MSGCMETDKPLIGILMAVYEPRLDWLQEQLMSLDVQTYPNLRLYIRDDCSPTVPFEEIEACVRACIHAFPYELRRNEKNLGSNGTFQLLTQEGEGTYFAYCDQDDIWYPDKLLKLEREMTPNVQMAYCDMAIADAEGRKTAGSLQEIRPRLHYVQGENLAETYFFCNCTAGCSMLIRADLAKRAVPFPEKTVCDHWLAIVAAAAGGVSFHAQPLQLYRQHQQNQTGILTGVVDKRSYREKRLDPLRERLRYYRAYARPSEALCAFISARLQGDFRGIWKGRRYCMHEAVFEMVALSGITPDCLTKWCLRRLK